MPPQVACTLGSISQLAVHRPQNSVSRTNLLTCRDTQTRFLSAPRTNLGLGMSSLDVPWHPMASMAQVPRQGTG